MISRSVGKTLKAYSTNGDIRGLKVETLQELEKLTEKMGG
jgi:hypothetical protein